jgi:peptidoglycan/xylan/chitin deacetylase (PgdA/CDA1 family)
MADEPPSSERPQALRPASSSRSELEARKRARLVQVRRRRAVALLVIGLIVLGIGAIMVDQSGGARSHDKALDVVEQHDRLAKLDPTVFAAAITAAVNRVLTYTPYISVGRPRRREVALTFDDGPGPYTLRILAVLRRDHAPATFFEIGRLVDAYPSITKRLADAGEVIGDHTQNHPFLASLTPAEQRDEVVDAEHAITRADAPAPHLFRPPYGSFNRATLAILRAQKQLMVLWTVDTGDYARPGAKRIVEAAAGGARPGAIVLLHDGGGDRSETVAALPRIIRYLRRHRYRLVTVPDLVRDDPPLRGQPAPEPLSGAG